MAFYSIERHGNEVRQQQAGWSAGNPLTLNGKPIEDATVYHIATQVSLLMVEMVLPPLPKGKRVTNGRLLRLSRGG